MVDRASALRPDTRTKLEQMLVAFEAKTGHQIVVHVTPSLEGLPIEDYSMRFAEAWRVGQKGLDNGVILTIAPNERELRIEVGYGLEGVLPDAIAARIRDQMFDEFRAGRFDEGVVAGVGAIMAVTQGEVLPLPARREPVPWLQLLILLVVLGLFVSRGGLFWWAMLGAARGDRRFGAPMRGPWGGGFGGRGGFGGGGFSGGGGGFGGGGASGRW